MDETFGRVGVGGNTYSAVDKHGQLVASMLSDSRNTNAAYSFLHKAIKVISHSPPSSIRTDKLAAYAKAILRLQNQGLLSNTARRSI